MAKAASLERTLDRTIDALTTGPQTREARALLIEARRLRSVIANWRSIPPPADVRDEMVERVLQISTSVGADPLLEDDGPGVDPQVSFDAGHGGDDDAYSLDFEPHLYSLEGITTQRQAIPPPPRAPRTAVGYDSGAAFGRGSSAAPNAPAQGYPAIEFEPAGLRPAFDDEIPIPDAPPGRRPRGSEPPPTAPRGAAMARMARPATAAPAPRRSAPPPPVTMGDTPKPPDGPVAMGAARAVTRQSEAPPAMTVTRSSSVPAPMPRAAMPVTMGETPKPPARPVTMGETPNRPARPVATVELPKPAAKPAVRESTRPPAPSPLPPAPRVSEPQARSSPPPAPRVSEPPPALRESEPAPEPARTPSISPPRADLGLEPPDELGVPRTLVTAEAVKLAEPIPAPLVFLTAQYGTSADAYRALRRKLAAGGNPRVIGVTSAHPGEGKTIFALNLALALRESARGRVLLVEANHRAPAFTTLLGFSPSICFLHQLANHVEDPRAPWVAQEPVPKLHVMAIDPKLPREPLLDPVAFGTGMERLKQAGYDYLIVDSPPVIGSMDCNVISDSVEGMIFTALTMKSKRREMRKAVEQLEPSPIFGVVVVET